MRELALYAALTNACTRHHPVPVEKVVLEDDRIVIHLKRPASTQVRVERPEKPFKGEIHDWNFFDGAGRRYVAGILRHEACFIRTSYVVNHNHATGEIETRNSRYRLIGQEKV